MLYSILKPFVRFILHFFIKNLTINGLNNIPTSGALLLASNHPNSFFDAILLACILDRPLWSLARGDVFRKKGINKFFFSLKMLPVYRLSEGKEFLSENDETFNQCLELFQKEEVVLIFSEGICTHQQSILPLKKGTARLVQKAINQGIEIQVLPATLRYDSFTKFGKTITINFGEIFPSIATNSSEKENTNGSFLIEFNKKLLERLKKLYNFNFSEQNFGRNFIFYIGFLANFPLYFLCKVIAKKLTATTVFYDSVLFGLLVFLLPIYWILLFVLLLA